MCKIFTIVLLLLNFIYPQLTTVIDKNTSLPLSEVNIYTKESGTTTTNDGVCDLNIFSSNDIITFSLIGYKTISMKKSQIPNIL